MAASGHAACHADVSMTSSGGSGLLTSAWPMLTSSLIRSTLTQSMVSCRRSQGGPLVSQRVSPTGGTRVSVSCKKKKKKGSASSGRISSRASLLLGPSRPNSARLLLFSFLFSFPRLTAWAHVSASPGSRAASSRSGVNSSTCVCVCCVCWAGSPRRERDVAAWARRCSLATAARPGV